MRTTTLTSLNQPDIIDTGIWHLLFSLLRSSGSIESVGRSSNGSVVRLKHLVRQRI